MTEHVNQFEQVAQELLQKAEKETDTHERQLLEDLAHRYHERAEQVRHCLTIEFELSPEIQPKG